MKILLIKFRNIGDVLLSAPLIENLKFNYPNVQIDYALNSNCSDMMTYNPNINKIFAYDRKTIKKSNLFFKIVNELSYIKKIISNRYDIVINLTEGDRGAIIALLCKAQIKCGFRPRKGLLKYLHIYNKIGKDNHSIHTIDKDLQFINLLNKQVINKNVSIFWSKETQQKITELLDKNNIKDFVHIHPVSRWMFKCWEDERMAKIIDYIQIKKNITVVITAGAEQVELARVEHILSLCKTQPINLSAQLTLKELAYLASKAKLFFGVDTAPMHIAAAVGTKVIALFGASRADLWGPWDNHKMDNEYKNINGIQKMGKNSIISNTNHEIFYENNIKKCRGMKNIELNNIIKIIDEKI